MTSSARVSRPPPSSRSATPGRRRGRRGLDFRPDRRARRRGRRPAFRATATAGTGFRFTLAAAARRQAAGVHLLADPGRGRDLPRRSARRRRAGSRPRTTRARSWRASTSSRRASRRARASARSSSGSTTPGPAAGAHGRAVSRRGRRRRSGRVIFHEAPLALVAAAIFSLGLFALFVFLRDRRQVEFLIFFLFTVGRRALPRDVALACGRSVGMPLTPIFRLNFALAFSISALLALFFYRFYPLASPRWIRARPRGPGPVRGARASLAACRRPVPAPRRSATRRSSSSAATSRTSSSRSGAAASRTRARSSRASCRLRRDAPRHRAGPGLLSRGRPRSRRGPRVPRLRGDLPVGRRGPDGALRVAAATDPLTGLPNRTGSSSGSRSSSRARSARAGRSRSPSSTSTASRSSTTATAPRRRPAPIAAGEALTDALRTTDLAVRFGGEEFVVLLPEIGARRRPPAPSGSGLAVARSPRPGNRRPRTASIGSPCTTEDGAPPGAAPLLREADTALYRAKALGRDRVCLAEGPVAGERLGAISGDSGGQWGREGAEHAHTPSVRPLVVGPPLSRRPRAPSSPPARRSSSRRCPGCRTRK